MQQVQIPPFNYKAPIYAVPRSAEGALRAYLGLMEHDHDKEFFLTVITGAMVHGELLDNANQDVLHIDTAQLIALIQSNPENSVPTSMSALYTRLKRYKDNALFTSRRIGTKAQRGYRGVYELADINTIAKTIAYEEPDKEPQFAERSSRNKRYHQALKDKQQQLIADTQFLTYPQQLGKAHSERLLNGVFFSCGRQSRHDQRKHKIVTSYSFHHEGVTETINITATSGGGTDLFSLEDQTTVLAIITLVIHFNDAQIKAGKDPADIENRYHIDICDVCRIMGLPTVGSNRNTIRASFERLYHSNLNVACPDNSAFSKYFGLSSYTLDGQKFTPNDMNFRFILELDSITEEDDLSNVRRPRYYRISLHPLIFKQLLDRDVWNTFIIDPKLLQNRLKMVTLLYFFASRIIAKRSGAVKSFNIETVKRYMMPSFNRLDNWQRSLFNELAKHAAINGVEWDFKGINTVEIYGYFVKVEPSAAHGYLLTFWFNDKHPVLRRTLPTQRQAGAVYDHEP